MGLTLYTLGAIICVVICLSAFCMLQLKICSAFVNASDIKRIIINLHAGYVYTDDERDVICRAFVVDIFETLALLFTVVLTGWGAWSLFGIA